MHTKQALIQVRNLVATYDDEVILDGVSLDVMRGEILVILGGSGCGKTTLMRHMVGLNHPQSGRILINDIQINSEADTALGPVLRNIGILFQGGALFGSMTLAENVSLAIEEYTDLPDALIRNLVKMKLSLVGLDQFENYLPSEISGGMKKRAALARAMALNPEILFLDEPSAGLDPITSAEIDDLLLHINRTLGTTMVIVTHELASIFKVAQRVIMLDKDAKGIIAHGNPMELREDSGDPRVRRFFNPRA
jgi:phospholipid/cholesterol/gamma-HCH transport system ATP-binding protein